MDGVTNDILSGGKQANGFRRSKGIDNILEDRLLSDAKRKGYSNILIVLNKYLGRK